MHQLARGLVRFQWSGPRDPRRLLSRCIRRDHSLIPWLIIRPFLSGIWENNTATQCVCVCLSVFHVWSCLLVCTVCSSIFVFVIIAIVIVCVFVCVCVCVCIWPHVLVSLAVFSVFVTVFVFVFCIRLCASLSVFHIRPPCSCPPCQLLCPDEIVP